MSKLLELRDLKTHYFTREGVVKAVDRVSLDMEKGENLGIAGESGCGKSTLGLSILRLVRTPGRIVGGEILFNGEDIVQKSDEEMRRIRGARISIIFQDPTSSLNPVYTIGDQIGESISLHQYRGGGGVFDWLLGRFKRSRAREVDEKVEDILREIGISDASKRRRNYPHEFSGGMRQRAMIAMALSCRPDLLIADEPTTNLDVTIEAQILDLMKELQKEFDTSVILISHNLGIISELCEKIVIMYAGNIMEFSDIKTLFESPKHPYTEALLNAIPRLGSRGKRLVAIPGEVPNQINPPHGCKFHPRCKDRIDGICNRRSPPTIEIEPGIKVSCYKYISKYELSDMGLYNEQKRIVD